MCNIYVLYYFGLTHAENCK